MTLSLSGALAAWQFLALAILVAGAAFASVYFARKHLAAKDGPSEGADGAFWDVFAGLAVVVPVIVLASSTWPWAGLAFGILAAGAALAALAAAPRLLARQEARRASRETQLKNEAAAARHRNALARWQRYELDPGYSIDYPAMSDPRQPETAALIRAIKAAEHLAGPKDHACTDTAYAPAVERLEDALAAAERAAGVSPAGRPGQDHAHS
jgi:membrane protein implicated in regulation of membrane protease activity